VSVVKVLNGRQRGGKQECGVVNVRSRLANDLKKFSHKPEAVCSGVENRSRVDGHLSLTSS